MSDAPRFKFYWSRKEGHSVLTMSRQLWDEFNINKNESVVIDVEVTPIADVKNDAILVAVTATQNGPSKADISVFRLDENAAPTPYNVDEYDVWTDLNSHPNLEDMIVAASTSNNENFKLFCKENVFLVKREAGKDHWLAEIPAHVKLLIQST